MIRNCLPAIALVLLACPSMHGHTLADDVPPLFEALGDSIVKVGAATRVVDPWGPRRDEVPVEALTRLGSLLHAPVVHGLNKPVSCAWAPVDSTAVGMDASVPEFRVWGDSARVSVELFCAHRSMGRDIAFMKGITWMLVRTDGRWRVVLEMFSIT